MLSIEFIKIAAILSPIIIGIILIFLFIRNTNIKIKSIPNKRTVKKEIDFNKTVREIFTPLFCSFC